MNHPFRSHHTGNDKENENDADGADGRIRKRVTFAASVENGHSPYNHDGIDYDNDLNVDAMDTTAPFERRGTPHPHKKMREQPLTARGGGDEDYLPPPPPPDFACADEAEENHEFVNHDSMVLCEDDNVDGEKVSTNNAHILEFSRSLYWRRNKPCRVLLQTVVEGTGADAERFSEDLDVNVHDNDGLQEHEEEEAGGAGSEEAEMEMQWSAFVEEKEKDEKPNEVLEAFLEEQQRWKTASDKLEQFLEKFVDKMNENARNFVTTVESIHRTKQQELDETSEDCKTRLIHNHLRREHIMKVLRQTDQKWKNSYASLAARTLDEAPPMELEVRRLLWFRFCLNWLCVLCLTILTSI